VVNIDGMEMSAINEPFRLPATFENFGESVTPLGPENMTDFWETPISQLLISEFEICNSDDFDGNVSLRPICASISLGDKMRLYSKVTTF
jgi:hypothetical protein